MESKVSVRRIGITIMVKGRAVRKPVSVFVKLDSFYTVYTSSAPTHANSSEQTQRLPGINTQLCRYF
jgi:hypothetical protein